jgi:subtilisin family serine protease
VFPENVAAKEVPYCSVATLIDALAELIELQVDVINLSVMLPTSFGSRDRELEQVLGQAAARGVLVVAAAGNQGTLVTTCLTRHPWVIPVAAVDAQGKPLWMTNVSRTIGSNGLGAPGYVTANIRGQVIRFTGTSAAAPFVTGTIALLRSMLPRATASSIRAALVGSAAVARRAIVPPLLDAESSWLRLKPVGDDSGNSSEADDSAL